MKKYAIVVQGKKDKKASLAVFIAENSEDALQLCNDCYENKVKILSIAEIPGVKA